MSVFLLLAAASMPPGPGLQAGPDDLARRAADLLVERCVSCHGPDSDQPKAIRGWADANDLASTVLDPELVVKGDPQDSYLYLVIEDGDMPPDDCEIPQLDPDEQRVISDWITAGAELPEAKPEISPEPHSGSAAEEVAPTAPTGITADPMTRGPWMKAPWPKWFGRLHPVMVHFPIALLTAAFAAELLAKLLRKPELRVAATFSYTLGALSTVPAAACGWLLAESSSHRGDTLDLHRWLGVAVGVIALLGLRAFYTRPSLRLPLLALLAGLASAAGHLGGELSYGADWLELP